MCSAKNRPQWCRITACEKCPFYNVRTIDNKTIDVSFVPQSIDSRIHPK